MPTLHQPDEVRSVQRTLSIIEALGQAENGMTLAALSESLALPPATVHRLLANLEGRGFASRDPESNRHYLATKILQLQGTIAARQSLVRPAIPILIQLAKRFSCTAHLAVLGEDRVVYVESRRSNPYTLEHLPPGRTNPIHCTALGKVLVAFAPAEHLKTLVERITFEASTPNTITGPDRFYECLSRVRVDGFAVDNEELTLGLRCIAAPVFDHRGNCIVAISITMPVATLPADSIPEAAAVVVSAAAELSRGLGRP